MYVNKVEKKSCCANPARCVIVFFVLLPCILYLHAFRFVSFHLNKYLFLCKGKKKTRKFHAKIYRHVCSCQNFFFIVTLTRTRERNDKYCECGDNIYRYGYDLAQLTIFFGTSTSTTMVSEETEKREPNSFTVQLRPE